MLRPLKDFQHLIWDWNGTLLNDAWLCVDIMNDMLKSRDMATIDRAFYQREFTFPVINYYRRLGFTFQDEPFETVSTEFISNYESRKLECQLQEEARTLLESTRTLRQPQSILSAYKQDYLEDIMSRFELAHYFDHLMGQDDHHAHGKVERGIELIVEMGIDPREVLLIGDTVHDAEVAGEMGVCCYLVSSGHQHRQRLSNCNVPVFASLRELRQRTSN